MAQITSHRTDRSESSDTATVSLADWLKQHKLSATHKPNGSCLKIQAVASIRRIAFCLLVIMAISLYGFIYGPGDGYILKVISNSHIEQELSIKAAGNIFQQYLHNKIKNQTFYCNSSNFKYIDLLMQDIHKHNKTFNFKWTSTSITAALAANKAFVERGKNVRLKYYNNTLYLHIPYGYKGSSWAKKYCTAFITYFWIFTQKYRGSLPAFDIIIYVMDSLRYHYNFVRDYQRIPPIFVSESYQDNFTNVLFHGLPRSIVKNLYYKMQRFLSAENNSTDPDAYPTQFRVHKHLSFDQKINQVLFRGGMTNRVRDRAVYELNYANSNYSVSSSFINAKMIHPEWTPLSHRSPILCIPFTNKGTEKCWTDRMKEEDQEKYKYIVVIDGFTTRDGFVLQMPYDSVKLKYKSNLNEFWYYDLFDKENILYWNSTQELLAMVGDLYEHKIENIGQVAMNSVDYAKGHFDEKSLDCFTLHMINIYNEYFFNESAVELDENDRLVKPWDYIRIHNRKLVDFDTLLNTTFNMY